MTEATNGRRPSRAVESPATRHAPVFIPCDRGWLNLAQVANIVRNNAEDEAGRPVVVLSFISGAGRVLGICHHAQDAPLPRWLEPET